MKFSFENKWYLFINSLNNPNLAKSYIGHVNMMHRLDDVKNIRKLLTLLLFAFLLLLIS